MELRESIKIFASDWNCEKIFDIVSFLHVSGVVELEHTKNSWVQLQECLIHIAMVVPICCEFVDSERHLSLCTEVGI